MADDAWSVGPLDCAPQDNATGCDRLTAVKYMVILAIEADIVEPAAVPNSRARDAKDLPVLGTFLAAQADYLVTGDNDLLALKHRYAIVTPAEFWNRHGA